MSTDDKFLSSLGLTYLISKIEERIRNIQTSPSPTASSVPSGCIVIWSGTADNIPDGWVLCNGMNNTPDLRDRFVLGFGSRSVGYNGGHEETTLTVNQLPKHSHYIPITSSSGSSKLSVSSGGSFGQPTAVDVQTAGTGGGEPFNNMPPYYVLCYIMKL